MFGKIDVTGIIKAHFATLKSYGSGRYRPIDIALFTLVPAVFTFAFIYRGASITPAAATMMIFAASILTLLSSTLLYLVYRISSELDYRTRGQIKRQFIREINDNIFYTMLTSIISCILIFLSLLTTRAGLKALVDSIAFFCAASFILSLLMVLNRTHVLVRKTSSEED